MIRSRARARGGTEAVTLEFSIPMAQLGAGQSRAGDDDDDDDVCSICASTFCAREECCRTMTHLECCTQPLCAGCVSRMARACTCCDECDKVVVICPYCREISGVGCRDVFLGACKKPCKSCVASDADAQPDAAGAGGAGAHLATAPYPPYAPTPTPPHADDDVVMTDINSID